MPLHDWTQTPPGLFHHFRQSWTVAISAALNAGSLPLGFSALLERSGAPHKPNIRASEVHAWRRHQEADSGGVATMDPPAVRIVHRSDKEIYAARANRIVVRHHLGRIIAVIEIVSPGNKDSRAALHAFVEKSVEFLRQGIHLLVVDPFPPSPRDPHGMHQAIWDEIGDETFEFPPGKDRLLVSYESADDRIAYIEPLAVGDTLRDMPLFLASGFHVPVPLEPTYQATWDASPEEFRVAVETGIVSEGD